MLAQNHVYVSVQIQIVFVTIPLLTFNKYIVIVNQFAKRRIVGAVKEKFLIGTIES